MPSGFKRNYEIVKPAVILWIRRFYIIAFNIYAWYWLYREIFINHSPNFENYVLWFFTTIGMYFFVLDSKDLILRGKN
jgi:hypothetical protein